METQSHDVVLAACYAVLTQRIFTNVSTYDWSIVPRYIAKRKIKVKCLNENKIQKENRKQTRKEKRG